MGHIYGILHLLYVIWKLNIVNDLKEYVLPTYENAKRYKTLSNPDGDPPPSYEVAILHM